MTMRISMALAITLLFAGCSGNIARNGAVEDGRMVAELRCAQCHAIGSSGESAMPEAPVFRTILSRYRSDVLEEELVENIKVGHSNMPEFQFDPEAAGDLVAYLQSIQQRP